MEIQVFSNTILLRVTEGSGIEPYFTVGYPISKFDYYDLTDGNLILVIDGKQFYSLLEDTTINGSAPTDVDDAIALLGTAFSIQTNSVSGTFTTNDSQTVVVTNGLVTSITGI